MRYYEPGDTLADLDRDEARADAWAERAAARRWCAVCRTMGGHVHGCPEADDDIFAEEDES